MNWDGIMKDKHKNMEIKQLLRTGQEIWAGDKLTLSQIIVRMGKVFGDICRWERDAVKNKDTHTEDDLKKELGNMIFSTIRWCDDLGYDPEECIELAIDCQKKFPK
jgi:hypothetical protein